MVRASVLHTLLCSLLLLLLSSRSFSLRCLLTHHLPGDLRDHFNSCRIFRAEEQAGALSEKPQRAEFVRLAHDCCRKMNYPTYCNGSCWKHGDRYPWYTRGMWAETAQAEAKGCFENTQTVCPVEKSDPVLLQRAVCPSSVFVVCIQKVADSSLPLFTYFLIL